MYYFASDIHLGSGERSQDREKLLTRWLEGVSHDAKAIFLVGDIFDFWYEYKRVVPKGFTRLLGALSSLTDRGVEIHFFPGNHDMWVRDYLSEECGLIIHNDHAVLDLYGKKVYIAHGDDIVARQSSFLVRLMNNVFRSPAIRWMFSHLLHPNTALRLGLNWSSQSRKAKQVAHKFLEEDEKMVIFARKYLENHNIDFFMFGHNHCAEIYPLTDSSSAVFLGEWFENPTYATLSPSGSVNITQVA